jgi:signal transduction histidine kinase
MSAVSRRRILAGAAALGVGVGVDLFNRVLVRTGPPAAWVLAASAMVAVATVGLVAASWPGSRRLLPQFASVAATASIVLTAVHSPRVAPQDALWIVTEAGALLTLLVLVARWSPARSAWSCGALVASAQILVMFRVAMPTAPLEIAGAVVMWAVASAVAAGLGIYLRSLDRARARLVLDVRRAQRLELARDLHDFVAHDVTGMVVQAQAAQVVAEQNPDAALASLKRIEDAGLDALGSLDRTVHMLADLSRPAGGVMEPARRSSGSAASDARTLGLSDVFDLVGRFSTTDHAPVRLHVDTGFAEPIPPEVGSTAYRVVLEALTNVRRHAPSAVRVDVSLSRCDTPDGAALAVRVSNRAVVGHFPERTPLTRAASRQGLGLMGLAERVDAIGGTFVAAPMHENGVAGWCVTAMLPLRSSPRA